LLAASPLPLVLEREIARRFHDQSQFTVTGRKNGCVVVGGPQAHRWAVRAVVRDGHCIVTVRGRTPDSRRALRNALIGKAPLRTRPDEHHVLERRAVGSFLSRRRQIAEVGDLVERWSLWLDGALPRTRMRGEKIAQLGPGETPVYWWDERANFGDALGPWLVQRITGREAVNARRRGKLNPALFGVGSILGYLDRDDVDVWGAGLMAPLDDAKTERLGKRQDVRVHAVRGARTRQELVGKLGWDVPEIYGDPALLLPRFYRPKPGNPGQKSGVALVPHYVHRKYVKGAAAPGVNVVDVAEDVERVVDQIANAGACVSTSLHGVVVAQAYGVPWVWLRVTDHPLGGDAFKFDDFFSTLDETAVASQDVESSEIGSLDLRSLAQRASLPRLTVSLDQLQDAFPLEAGPRAGQPFVLPQREDLLPAVTEPSEADLHHEALVAEFRKLLKATRDSNKTLKTMAAELKNQTRILESVRLASSAETMADVQEFVNARQLTMLNTLRRLATTDDSLARFGDGEFRLMLRSDYDVRFQRNSPELQRELLEVFRSTETPGFQIGFPQVFRDPHWTGVWSELWPQLRPALPPTGTYVNSHVTRPLAFDLLRDEAVELWRDVWRDRRVVVVTGAGSRFDADPALFSSADSLTIIESLATHAYSDLDRVTELLLSQQDAADLALISLGPAGTVLAHRLHLAGVRALDIGHLVNSYQHIFDGAPRPERTPLATES